MNEHVIVIWKLYQLSMSWMAKKYAAHDQIYVCDMPLSTLLIQLALCLYKKYGVKQLGNLVLYETYVLIMIECRNVCHEYLLNYVIMQWYQIVECHSWFLFIREPIQLVMLHLAMHYASFNGWSASFLLTFGYILSFGNPKSILLSNQCLTFSQSHLG